MSMENASEKKNAEIKIGKLALPTVIGYGVQEPGLSVKKMHIGRRIPDPMDVGIRVQFCGISLTDVKMMENEFGKSQYPMIPGHEITGFVVVTGKKVTRFQVGDRVGVGFLANSCRKCPPCLTKREQYCTRELWTIGYSPFYGGENYIKGGLCTYISADEQFVFHIPTLLPMEIATPLLSSGAEVYAPLKQARISSRTRVAVVGFIGSGHIAIMIAKAMGAKVWLVESEKDIEVDAKSCGAIGFILATDSEAMNKHSNTFDIVMDTTTGRFDYNDLLRLLRCDGKLHVIGINGKMINIDISELVTRRISITVSRNACRSETQEVLDFCAMQRIKPKLELTKINHIDEALEKLKTNNVRNSLVIDVDSMRDDEF
ncbi:hypothetical protein ACOME3_010010 [Neoechinorhynchus agilis]